MQTQKKQQVLAEAHNWASESEQGNMPTIEYEQQFRPKSRKELIVEIQNLISEIGGQQ